MTLHEIIKKYKKSSGNEFLDVACGTGAYISYLKDKYQTKGFDISEEMLKVAREKCPEIEFIQGDMTSMKLDQNFDIITCLFGSISYLTTLDDLAEAIKTFSNHLSPGGITIIEPLFTVETYRDRSMNILCLDLPEIKIARTNVTMRDGDIAYLNFHFLISTRENGIEHFVDPSPMGIFSRNSYLSLMKDCDLSASFIEPGLSKEGLFIGIKL